MTLFSYLVNCNKQDTPWYHGHFVTGALVSPGKETTVTKDSLRIDVIKMKLLQMDFGGPYYRCFLLQQQFT